MDPRRPVPSTPWERASRAGPRVLGAVAGLVLVAPPDVGVVHWGGMTLFVVSVAVDPVSWWGYVRTGSRPTARGAAADAVPGAYDVAEGSEAWVSRDRPGRGHAGAVTSTRVSRSLRAPRARVYDALVDPAAVARWRFPSGMTCQVHEFDGREGGSLRVSLTYASPDRRGKTTSHTDTYRGRFARLVPGELVVEIDEFETTDPALQGEMTMTVRLSDEEQGTRLVAVHEGLPPAVSPADNEVGWNQALDRLAALVENG